MRSPICAAVLAAAAALVLAGCTSGIDVETRTALRETLDSVQELLDLWEERLGEVETETAKRQVATSFHRTDQDHYPLYVKRVRPEAPRRSDFEGTKFYDSEGNLLPQEETEERVYQSALRRYSTLSRYYEMGVCCWELDQGDSEIASRAQVLAMLRESAFEWNGVEAKILTYSSPPVVRIVSGATREARAATMRAIDDINAWLPWEKHITVGADISETARPGPNVIRADLEADHLEGSGTGGYGAINIKPHFDPRSDRFNRDEAYDTWIIRHELLHALGMTGGGSCREEFGANCNFSTSENIELQHFYSHVPTFKFPESSMAYASPRNREEHGLAQIDGETIQALYTNLHDQGHSWRQGGAVEIRPDDLSPEALGPWDDFVVRYSGRFSPEIDYSYDRSRCWAATCYEGSVAPSFGVDWRNGMARPWAHGEVTGPSFADAVTVGWLSGIATWQGEMFGFTPAQEAVRGDSAIVVDLAALDGGDPYEVDLGTLTGRAAFTAIEHWNAGSMPGAPRTGARWNDGDLHYSLALTANNYLRSNGGDQGYVSGRFVGDRHEGAVGILERHDLTAAFGAMRD